MHACIQITDAEVIGIITIEINIFFNEGTISQVNPPVYECRAIVSY